MDDKQKEYEIAKYYFLSFPKCGRTWLRLMIGKYYSLFYNINIRNVIDLTKLYDARPKNIPYIVVTHEGVAATHVDKLSTDKSRYKPKKVMLLIRDPRDVVVSMFFQLTRRDNVVLYKNISDFLYRHDCLDRIIRWYNIWDKNKNVPESFLIIKYEDLKSNTTFELRKVMEFLGAEIKKNLLKETIGFAEFDKMKQMEKKNLLGSTKLATKNAQDSNSYKTRRGIVGGYKDYFSKEDIKYMNVKIKKNLSDFYGYYK